MYDLVVERNAKMPGESAVSVKARFDAVTVAVVDDEIVDFAGGDSRLDGIGADVADLGGHTARLAHPVDLRLRFYVDFHRRGKITSRT